MKKNYNVKTQKKAVPQLAKLWIYLLIIFVFSIQSIFAQLSGWAYKDGIKIQEHTGAQQLNYQVLLTINTATPIGAGKMNVKGNDIRFSKDCAGNTLYNYFLDTNTVNTANTQIWVEVDTLAASGNRTIYMWYGNNSAAASSNFNNTFPLSTQLVVPSGTVTLTGINNYSWFEVQAGATVKATPNAVLVINARMIRVAGTIDGNGAGFLGGTPNSNGSGPGAGKVSSGNLGMFGAGGAGYGGVGGHGGGAGSATAGNVGQPGTTYGTLNTDSIDMGSGGGGAASGGQGGAGGGAITLNADVVDISGTINSDGSDGVQSVLNGAGGAGGGVRVKGNKVSFTGIITAKGGNGQPGGYGSGGGGGGRIKIFSDASIVNSGITSVTGGAPGAANAETVMQTAGANGTTANGIYTSKVPTYSILPHVVLSSANTTICQGTPASFTATTGFNPYNFYVNATSKQNGASNTFTSTTLNNNDKVKVLGDMGNGCMDTSNVITVTVNPSPNITINPTSASYCAGTGASAALTASGASTYTWASATGLNTTNGAAVTANPNTTTQYTVMGTDANGCANWDTVTVTVNNCTGINQNSASGSAVSVYPNPTNAAFVVEGNFGDPKQVVVELKNTLGETVKVIDNAFVSGNYTKEVSVSELANGIYFLTIRANGQSQIKKIIKN
jgi:hypothetical protein